MSDQDDELRELKVVDRRRFIQEGDIIKENPDAAARPEPPAADEAPPPQPVEQHVEPPLQRDAQPEPKAKAPGTEPAEREQDRREAAQRRADQAAAGLPPADLATVVEFLAQQVTVYLGDPDPMGRAIQPNLPAAAMFLDLIGVLKEKTAGNLSLDESQYLDQVLYSLRLRYVQKRG